MSRTTSLKALLYEVISEIGDIQNIESYPFLKKSNELYGFETEQGDKVEVSFLVGPLGVLNIEDPNPQQTFTNVAFTISGSETQLKKSTYSYLIKIIKTVVDVLLDYLKTNHPKYIFISATSKSDEKSTVEFDSQKGRLYQAIMLKNINKLPKYEGEWKYKILDNALGLKGDSILLYNGN